MMDDLCFLLVPGLRDSDPDHWQSAWQQQSPHWKRERVMAFAGTLR